MQGNQSLLCMTVQTVYMANAHFDLEEGIEISWGGRTIALPLSGLTRNWGQVAPILSRLYPAEISAEISAVAASWHICAENDDTLLLMGYGALEGGEE